MEEGLRRERGIALLNQMLGEEEAAATRKAWEDVSPDFEQAVVGFLAGEIWSRPGLDLKTRSLCTISALVALGRWRGVELNLRMARNNGATEEEIVETLLQIAPYAGFPAAWEALVLARRVFHGQPAADEGS